MLLLRNGSLSFTQLVRYYLLLNVLNLLELELRVEYVLLVKDSVAELLVIDGLTQIALDAVLDDGHIEHLVNVGSKSLVGVQQLSN